MRDNDELVADLDVNVLQRVVLARESARACVEHSEMAGRDVWIGGSRIDERDLRGAVSIGIRPATVIDRDTRNGCDLVDAGDDLDYLNAEWITKYRVRSAVVPLGRWNGRHLSIGRRRNTVICVLEELNAGCGIDTLHREGCVRDDGNDGPAMRSGQIEVGNVEGLVLAPEEVNRKGEAVQRRP